MFCDVEIRSDKRVLKTWRFLCSNIFSLWHINIYHTSEWRGGFCCWVHTYEAYFECLHKALKHHMHYSMLTCTVCCRNNPCPVSGTKNTLGAAPHSLEVTEEPSGALQAILFAVQIKVINVTTQSTWMLCSLEFDLRRTLTAANSSSKAPSVMDLHELQLAMTTVTVWFTFT